MKSRKGQLEAAKKQVCVTFLKDKDVTKPNTMELILKHPSNSPCCKRLGKTILTFNGGQKTDEFRQLKLKILFATESIILR